MNQAPIPPELTQKPSKSAGIYYPERNNKPHNIKNGITLDPQASQDPQDSPGSTIPRPQASQDPQAPGLPGSYIVPEWMSIPDQIERIEPEYEILVDFTKDPGKRLTIQEIIRKLPGPKKSPEQILTDRFKIVPSCASGFMKGECTNGHRFARAMLCNKEFCAECGKKNSFAHKQRIARWFSKIMQFDSCGYMVITIPAELREQFKDKKILSEFRTYIKRKLQREGFDRGFSRYHWAGDCEECRGKGQEEGCLFCNNTGSSKVWKPHLNLLIEGKFIPKSDLERWRKDLSSYFNTRFQKEIGEDFESNLYYSYGKGPGYKIHKLKYVTRATWRFSDPYEFKDILDTIKGFRTSSSWGKFAKSNEPRRSALVHFVNNECPCCKEPIRWGGFESMSNYLLGKFNLWHIEGGYYKYQKIGSDPPPLDPLPDPIGIPRIQEPIKQIYKPIEIPF